MGMVMKGISPLLAAVLLIAMTVAVATLIMGWMSTITRTSQIKVENRTMQAIDCSSASISIEDVYLKPGNGTGAASVIVTNSGQADDLVIRSATLINASGGSFTGMNVPITDFDQGDVETITFSGINVSTCPDGLSNILVTTDCGGVSDKFVTAPKCYQ